MQQEEHEAQMVLLRRKLEIEEEEHNLKMEILHLKKAKLERNAPKAFNVDSLLK